MNVFLKIWCKTEHLFLINRKWQQVFIKNSGIPEKADWWRKCILWSSLSSSLRKNKKNPPRKKLLHFRKWNFLAPRLKKFLYFWKWNFLASYFSYISGRQFPRWKNKKNPALKKFLIFSRKKFFLYFGKRNFLIFSKKKLFLYFQKWNFLTLRTFRGHKIKKPFKKFLIYREMELSSLKIKKLLLFQEELPKPEKQTKKVCSEKISCHLWRFYNLYSSKA